MENYVIKYGGGKEIFMTLRIAKQIAMSSAVVVGVIPMDQMKQAKHLLQNRLFSHFNQHRQLSITRLLALSLVMILLCSLILVLL